MRAVFLGTPEFAVPSLRALAQHHQVVAVITQPDRPKGRRNQVAASAVKQAATELTIGVYQPERVRRPESVELLRNFAAEIMVVVGYGQIIPQPVIDLPRFGILNVHASLLPKYRGAAPIQWAIAKGELETGVTIMQIDAGLDTGDMLKKGTLSIGADETAPALSARLARLGADLLIETISELAAGTVNIEKQNHTEATLAPILKKEDGLIDWRRGAEEIYARFRGFNPWPGSYTSFRTQPLSITGMRMAQHAPVLTAGECAVHNKRWMVGCGASGAVEIVEVQMAGKKRMTAAAFLNGYPLKPEETLGV